ncbi:MAG: 2-amino-4-hydroxy-6-hydroxymethyldihydropteridine diphosphokinase [Acidobacteria bacterium]|nr:MAG: 2-amino-4-hydroxy-6-hydroxymethyldihydropteridine diphosphokinase [Acidobacteriota bacterium]
MDGYIGLGSNLGEPVSELRAGTSELLDRGVTITQRSSVYRTEPVDAAAESQAWFLNAVFEIRFAGGARDLLDICRAVENVRGRERGVKNGPRTLDLDLLLAGELVVSSNDLTIPHPRLHLRRFVLVPIVEIAPDVIHPVKKRTMRELLAVCDDESAVLPLEDVTG